MSDYKLPTPKLPPPDRMEPTPRPKPIEGSNASIPGIVAIAPGLLIAIVALAIVAMKLLGLF